MENGKISKKNWWKTARVIFLSKIVNYGRRYNFTLRERFINHRDISHTNDHMMCVIKFEDEFFEKFSDRIMNKYVIYTKDYKRENGVDYIPVYMTIFL